MASVSAWACFGRLCVAPESCQSTDIHGKCVVIPFALEIRVRHSFPLKSGSNGGELTY